MSCFALIGVVDPLSGERERKKRGGESWGDIAESLLGICREQGNCSKLWLAEKDWSWVLVQRLESPISVRMQLQQGPLRTSFDTPLSPVTLCILPVCPTPKCLRSPRLNSITLLTCPTDYGLATYIILWDQGSISGVRQSPPSVRMKANELTALVCLLVQFGSLYSLLPKIEVVLMR